MAERVIGAFIFPTRKAAEREIRRILHDSPLDIPLQSHEHDLIAALASCHHEAETKIGVGIQHITVRQVEYGSRGFWITRTDGTSVDFSYRTALDGAPSHRQQVNEALRVEVSDEIIEFRHRWFAENANFDGMVTCPLTGVRFPHGRTAHVDHVLPFAELVERFVKLAGGYEQLECVPEPHGIGRPRLRDREIAAAWQRFHADNAQLRVIHASANLARYVKREGVA